MSFYCLRIEDDLVHVKYFYNYSDDDYNITYLLRNPDDKEYLLRFDSEREAKQYLNEKIKTEHIHPDWVDTDLNQEKLFK